MIITIIAAAVSPVEHDVNNARLLACIRMIEGHAWTDAGGAYGIQLATWRQHTRLPYALASRKEHADRVAELHLRWLARSLRDDGYEVTPYTLAGCWRWGLEGFKSRSRATIDYALRVSQLYASEHKL